MNAIEKGEYEKLEKLVDHYRTKFTNAVEGGIRTAQKALNRRKRTDDLRRAYVLAAEGVFRALDMLSEGQVREWTPEQRLAFTRLKGAREDLGLVKREHEGDDCQWKCSYHRRDDVQRKLKEST